MEYEDLQRLEEAQGESFYLIDSALFRDNLREMREAFRAYYPEANIAYSFKTNYIPALCRIVKEEGAYAEVVSEMECELAGKMGFAAGDIYYNGPYKKRAYVMEMLRRGVRINLDNYQEFEMALEAAEGQPVQVGLRCNFDIGSGKISRFGFDVEGEEFRRVIARIKSEKNLSLIGLHCHFPDRRLEWYANRVEQMKRVLDSLGDAALKYISFGGGYFGRIPAAFQKAFAAPVPSYEDYAQVIAKEMDSYFSGGGVIS